MYLIEELREKAVRTIQKTAGVEEIAGDVLEYPTDPQNGDLAFPCFVLAKEMEKAPPAIAEGLAASIKLPKEFAKVEAKGPYLNFFFDRSRLYEDAVKQALKEKDDYGRRRADKKEKVMVEYVSPNNNKPLHLGHIRNGLIGESVSAMLESQGHEVVRAMLLNDRGLAIAKAMVAYAKWGDGKTPEDVGVKSDRFVGDLYVKFDQKAKDDPSLEDEAHEVIRKWEAGDEETRALWQKLNDWAEAGQQTSYKRLGFCFDVTYKESEIYQEGKKIVDEGLEKGSLKRDETGAVMAPLEADGMPDKVVLRADGTALYITQDLVLAKKKFEDHGLDRSIYVVGNEQNLHMKQLFRILELLGYSWAIKMAHLSYGYVSLPEGRMKSREGTVVEADELLSMLEADAALEIKQRHPTVTDDELVRRAHQLALSALKFYFLEVDIASDMIFDPKASLSFNGKTGPYLQYSYARIRSIMRKADDKLPGMKKPKEVTDEEHRLVMMVSRYPEVLAAAAGQHRPSLLANHLYETARALAGFYEAVQVLNAPDKERAFRLNLISAVALVLKNGLEILGIESPEEM